jgi:hypothetical protein
VDEPAVPDEVPLEPEVFASAPLLVLEPGLSILLLPDAPPVLDPLEAANAGAAASTSAEKANAAYVVFM